MNQNNIQHWYLHVDLDAFFASVEQLDNIAYRGQPVIVGGKPTDRRSVVSTASYEARKYGVHSAMPTFMAYKLCPNGIYVYPRMERYEELSKKIMSIFSDFSPDVIQMSIDEAFIDLTGTEKLFGPPQQTALKIKEQVKSQTGLTVSIGLASNKYLAKIASGYNKPNGFFFIPPGTEQSFMLNLPLNKVWGIGSKTLEKLNKSGIFTTNDIYEKDLNILKFMFGSSTGEFLYNAVRGNEAETFSQKTKNHSISSETTFTYDITDSYTAETKILELAHEVFFRLLSNKAYSKTAFLKIRYDDFTTTSIQQTINKNFSTLDSFYEVLKNLFQKKYQPNRGIRLIGVGFENIEFTDKPYQQDFFDKTNQKQQALEKTILKLEQKNPNIKIKRARTLSLTIFALLLALVKPYKLYAQKTNTTTLTASGTFLSDNNQDLQDNNPQETPATLFNWKINDKNSVDFYLNGYWKGGFTSIFNLSFGNNNNLVPSITPPIFTQQVNLDTQIFLNNKWFFKAEFLDEFETNTFTLGYQGDEKSYIDQILISNRNIQMSNEYSINTFGYGLTGGKNQAPGISVSLKDSVNNKWKSDFLIKYDMVKQKNATFYGLNSVSDSYLNLENYINSRSFVFPENCSEILCKIKDVYVQNNNGKYKDNYGRSFIKLDSSQYTVSIQNSCLTLTQLSNVSDENKKPSILITFTQSEKIQEIIDNTGSYSDFSSFAGKIQKLFDQTMSKINLSHYTYNLQQTINGESCLVIQNPTGFSPYEVCNIYDLGIIKDAQVFVTSKTTEIINESYYCDVSENLYTQVMDDYFFDNHFYATILLQNDSEQTITSLQQPQNRFPFATECPEIYLNHNNNSDMTLLIRNYSSVSAIQITTDAIASSVRVYKNNILDNFAKYDQASGIITLSSNVNQTDKIYVTWEEDYSNFTNGVLKAGAGFIYNFTDNLFMDFALTSALPLSTKTYYTTTEESLQGYAALAAGITHSTKNFTFSNKSMASINSPSSAKNLLVAYTPVLQNKTFYLNSNDAYITQAEPLLNIESSTIQLTSNLNGTVKKHAGIEDSKITGYKIPLEFIFSPNQIHWAGVDIKLSSDLKLYNCESFEIALQPNFNSTSFLPSQNFNVYLQLGVEAASSFYGEDSQNICTFDITNLINLDSNEWQTISIKLTDITKSKLIYNKDARIIIMQKSEQTETISGTIYIGPYQPNLQIIQTEHDSNLDVSTSQILSTSPSTKSFSLNNKNYSNAISWNINQEASNIQDTNIYTTTYFSPADFDSFQTINFNFAYVNIKQETSTTTDEPSLTFILDSDASNIHQTGNVALKLQINDISSYISNSLTFNTLTIEPVSQKVYINSQLLDSSLYTIYINNKVIPNRQKIIINTTVSSVSILQGQFYIDNLYYSDSQIEYNLKNNLYLEYNRQGKIIQDFDISLDSTQSLSKKMSNNLDFYNQSSYQTKIVVSDVLLNTNGNLVLSEQTIKSPQQIFKDINHTVQTQKPLLNTVSFSENFNVSFADGSKSKQNSIKTDFNSVHIPIFLSASTTSTIQKSIQTQNAQSEFNFSKQILNTNILFNAKLINTQKSNTLSKSSTYNYFKAWYQTSQYQLSIGESDATQRKTNINSNLCLAFPFANFKPNLTYDIISFYTHTTQNIFTDNTTLSLEFPFTLQALKNHSFSLSYKRVSNGIQNTSFGGNYYSDTQNYFALQTNREYFYQAIPFYELFDKNIPALVEKGFTNLSQENSYSSQYTVSWKRKLFYSYSDFFIPTNTSLTLSRDTKFSLESSDIYQIKASINNVSLNNFGNFSKLKLFNWYQQDEFVNNLTVAYKIPVKNRAQSSLFISGYNQVIFYISNLNDLKTALDYSLENKNNYLNWQTGFSMLWTRNSTNSPLVFITQKLIKKAQDIDFNLTRKNSLSLSIGQSDQLFKQSYECTHQVDLDFLRFYTISFGLTAKYTYVQDTASNLILASTMGAKINF